MEQIPFIQEQNFSNSNKFKPNFSLNFKNIIFSYRNKFRTEKTNFYEQYFFT